MCHLEFKLSEQTKTVTCRKGCETPTALLWPFASRHPYVPVEIFAPVISGVSQISLRFIVHYDHIFDINSPVSHLERVFVIICAKNNK